MFIYINISHNAILYMFIYKTVVSAKNISLHELFIRKTPHPTYTCPNTCGDRKGLSCNSDESMNVEVARIDD